ncbi:DMT family transporter [Candidatus Promineifilum breve]|uniref:DMT family transporter n=1 Tax=Candidatus Promineifilum breve TaxID=1806508 RepID=UPI000BA21F5A|nr:DMT family transporter [Candidatus Promineifilum breve]
MRANLLLLLAAFIWGFSFVAQRTGMAHLGPFAFNAVRFLLGGLVLLPLMGLFDRQRQRVGLAVVPLRDRRLLRGGAVVGLLLFGGATLQQAGIVFTTAGKAGFITSLYVVLVPLLGLLVGHRPSAAVWVGAVLAAAGLYFLTIEGAFGMAWGDLLVLVGAFVWAIHFLVLGHFSPQTDTIKLSFLQFMVCAALSAVAALLFETSAIADFRAALIPILYSGILSVGLGYTLQVVALGNARPADAAILLSLEAVFAVFAGWLLLGEQLTSRAFLGCVLMLAGILISQLFGEAEAQGSRGAGEQG